MKIEIHRVSILEPSRPTPTQYTERCSTPDGVVHTGPGCIGTAARHMIGRGVSPRASMRVLRDGKVVLTGRIEAFARQAWGGQARDPHPRNWTPHPDDVLPPKLQAWWESQQG